MQDIQKLVDESIIVANKALSEGRGKDVELLMKHVVDKFDPINQSALQLLGLAYHQQGKYQEGIEIFSKALELDPTNAENHSNIGLCYGCLEFGEKAIEHIRKAISLKPKEHNFYNNLGHQFRLIRMYDAALEEFKKGLALSRNSLGLYNVGGCYLEMLEAKKAIKYLQLATEINPDDAAAFVGLAYAYQLLGDWEQSWKYYEYRMQHFKQAKYFEIKYDQNKKWHGENICDKKLIVYCEQGLGDIICFIRFISFISMIKANVTIECPPSLNSLLISNGYKVTNDGSNLDYDYHCSIMSLPYLLDLKGFETVANVGTYLSCFKSANIGHQNKIKIGIVWAGSPQHQQDRSRSTWLKNFKRIHDLPGVKLFSLQKDTRTRIWPPSIKEIDLSANTTSMKVIDMSPFMDTLEDTAALIQSMDLIITVDTAVMHLAGALGKPTWGLLAYETDTRWGFNETTFWYPSLKFFRQPSRDDWHTVFKNVTRELITHFQIGNKQ